MPELKCTVDSCYYNKRQYCCKGTIEVTGRDAHKTDDTCCDSFVEREREGYKNSYSEEHPCKTIDVACRATDCVYNSEENCDAREIGICGSHAKNSHDTECASFRCS